MSENLFDEYDDDELNDTDSLGCPLWVENDLYSIINYMTESTIYPNSVKNKTSPIVSVPRFGIYSELLKLTPIYIFDNPILEKHLGDTACTDGKFIFINLNFYKKLYEEENIEKEKKTDRLGIIPLLLHEISHIFENDINRFRNVNPLKANIAQDLYINSLLKSMFYEVKWLPSLMENGFGLKVGDEYYKNHSVDYILEEIDDKIYKNILPEITKEEIERINNKDLHPSERGRSIEKIKNEPQNKNNNKSTSGSGSSTNQDLDEKHQITSEDLAKALSEAGLDAILEKLDLSDYLDEKKKKQREEQDKKKNNVNNAIANAETIRKKARLDYDSFPGGETLHKQKNKIAFELKGKLKWQHQLNKDIWGDGPKESYNYDVPSDVFYIDEIGESLGMNLYEGTFMQVKQDKIALVILDTSGSMSYDDLSESLTEIMSLRASANNSLSAKEVIVVSADTSIDSNNIIIINENNYKKILSEKNFEISGSGGTDLLTSLNQALNLKEVKGRDVSSILYFTDLGDLPPRLQDINLTDEQKNNISFSYITTNQSVRSRENFEEKVKDYASVYLINDNITVNLNDTMMELKRKGKGNKFKI